MFDFILLAVDGSEHANRAAKTAANLARLANSKEIRIVVAFDPVPSYLGEPNLNQVIASRKREADRILTDAKALIGTTPAQLHEEILEGPVADAILNVAATRKVDVIVMGSRGLGRLEGALLGSNSQKVVSLASCPVLIVR
ncbi:MAG TPA: universal stress protein [Anaerolineales bacterium]|nr:universal stress protein [Anaerolineales bacterium]